MSMEPQVKPLRISKNTPQSTPKKMSGGRTSGQANWPLSEVSPMGIRRNSPSHYSPSNMPGGFKADSSPFDPSPGQAQVHSPRHFWKEKERYSPSRGIENTPSPRGQDSPTRRSSIEKLKKASRVKNSSMFAREATQEYDPTREPVIERPLANRPLSLQVQGNAWAGKGLEGFRNETNARKRHSRTESVTQLPDISTPKTQTEKRIDNKSPNRSSPSPTKSSLSSTSKYERRSFGPDAYSDEESPAGKTLPPGKSLHRHAKSVTFDAAPPEVRQFEMPTPELSSVGTCSPSASYNSEDEDSFEQDEDTQRQNEIVPEHNAKTSLYDPFVELSGSSPNGLNMASFSSQDTAESSSPGDRRPLPPLPGLTNSMAPAQTSRNSTPDRSSPAGSIVRSDLSGGKPTLSERLHMIMNKEGPRFDTASMQAQRERRLRRAGSKEPEKAEPQTSSPARPLPVTTSPSASFSSADTQIRVEPQPAEEEHEEFHSFLDPDMPLPSTETADDESIKSDDDSTVDLYSIPQASFSQIQIAMPSFEAPIAQNEIDNHSSEIDATNAMMHNFSKLQLASKESTPAAEAVAPQISAPSAITHEVLFSTPIDADEREVTPVTRNSMTIAPASIREPTVEIDKDAEDDVPSSPESVIRHPVIQEPIEESVEEPIEEPVEEQVNKLAEEPVVETPVIPEPVATIKSSGGKLKVRASATPADLAAMAAVRRQVSGEKPSDEAPEPPPRSPRRLSAAIEADSPAQLSDKAEAARARRRSLLQLDMPVMATSDDFGFGLDEDFNRVIEHQKRGYLMRQNTKVIVASSAEEQESAQDETDHIRGTRSAGNSPIKKSRQSLSWQVEPWNGRTRRNSIKSVNGSQVRRKGVSNAPPLPGQESVVNEMESVTEDLADEPELGDDGERGRLFVKVMAVKDLDLQLPSGERAWFNLTLDNGLHCVTTAWLELGRNAPIGQEFELIVLNDLEFQLTLQAKMEKPVHHVAFKAVPEKTQKSSALSRVFASPKKRKERERQEEEERQARQRQQDLAQRRPTVYDALQGIAGEDGTFARSYICSKDHEKQSYGRVLTVEVPCFNEWAVDKAFENPNKKRALSQAPRRPPYKIGKLELQLLFVPKPKSVAEPEMPKSMNMCLRQLNEARTASAREWQGHLSQQGGDCPYWRRRLFKISGTKMTAYHEATRQIRATINLVKATRLIDDRSALTKKEVGSGKSRRKSGFTDEEEGYTFVENGFRIKFSNGETIDFYANTAQEKEGAMKVLSDIVGKDNKPGWIQLVLAREAEELKAAKQQAAKTRPLPASHQRAPPSPTRAAPAARAGASPVRPGAASPTRPTPRAGAASPTRPAPRAGAASPTRPGATPNRGANRASYMGNTPGATPRMRYQPSPEKRRPVSTII